MGAPDGLIDTPHHPALGIASLDWSKDYDERQWWHLHSATGRQATPSIRRPRVLLEMPGIALRATVGTLLREEGYDVTVCAGPGCTPFGCPLTKGLRCPIADQADVIVHDLGLTTPEGRAVWKGHDATHANTPRVLVQGVGDPPVRPGPGREMLLGPLTRQAVLAAVERAATGRS